MAGVALPLIKAGKSVGVLLFFISQVLGGATRRSSR